MDKHYIVDGVIGIVHQGFEKMWMDRHRPNPLSDKLTNILGNMLHLGNFPKLDRYVRADFADQDVENVTNSIVQLLESMPQDEESLRQAFKTGFVVGKPLQQFRGLADPQKFKEFVEFSAGDVPLMANK